MKILYIFPHPDDESFGPAPAISSQLRDGHEVYLLTLTKGEATKVRHELGLTLEEMGEVRYKEMLDVEKTLGLIGMTVLDLPDSALKSMCPQDIESVVEEHIHKIQPDVIVTYAVHGISGFHDHLVSHAVVKRVFCEMKRVGSPYPKRLALFTLGSDYKSKNPISLSSSSNDEIDCIVQIDEVDSQNGKKALDCYKTYQKIIERTGIYETTHYPVHFEFFGESFNPPVANITDRLE